MACHTCSWQGRCLLLLMMCMAKRAVCPPGTITRADGLDLLAEFMGVKDEVFALTQQVRGMCSCALVVSEAPLHDGQPLVAKHKNACTWVYLGWEFGKVRLTDAVKRVQDANFRKQVEAQTYSVSLDKYIPP
eukprot:1158299-Pelagomonas_calceolata.AAC.4